MADSSKSYKLIISDFDGTLAGADHQISDKVKDAIHRWMSAGNLFTVASGRQFEMIGYDCRDLNIKTPFIVRGGAEIVDPITREILFSEHIDKKTTKDFINLMMSTKYRLFVEVGDSFYANYDYDLSYYPSLKKLSIKDIPYVGSPKINVRARSNEVEELEKFMKKNVIPKFPQLSMIRSYNALGMSWDITSIKATKHLAILNLMKILNIDVSRTIGIGDGYNDFPLLEAVGFKVAMGNANDELKEIADMTVPSLDDDGVAYLIDKLLE